MTHTKITFENQVNNDVEYDLQEYDTPVGYKMIQTKVIFKKKKLSEDIPNKQEADKDEDDHYEENAG